MSIRKTFAAALVGIAAVAITPAIAEPPLPKVDRIDKSPTIILITGIISGKEDLECESQASIAKGEAWTAGLVARDPGSLLCKSRPSKNDRVAFERAFAAEFQALPACRGITLLPVPIEKVENVVVNGVFWENAEQFYPWYSLILNRDGRSFITLWGGDYKGANVDATSAREMVQHVCSIAQGKGGKVVQ
jgi:hypothetical protein